MATSTSKKNTASTKSTKAVKVELEKAEEKIEKPVKMPVAQVPESIVASIKNRAQLEQEALERVIASEEEKNRSQTRNRLIFYGAVFAGAGIVYLLHKYSKTMPPSEFASSLVNGVKSQVP